MFDTAFSKALKVEVSDDDEEYVDAEDNDWFREVQASTTPAESLKPLRIFASFLFESTRSLYVRLSGITRFWGSWRTFFEKKLTPESRGAVRLPPFFVAFLHGNCPFWVLLCTELSLFGTKSCRKRHFWRLVVVTGGADVCPRAREDYLLTTSLVMCWTSAPVSTSSFFIDAMAM